MKSEEMKDLYVRTRVSLFCPQEVPARVLRMLRQGEARETRLICGGQGEPGVEGDHKDARVLS